MVDRDVGIKARRVEIDFFKARGVYTKCRRELGITMISTTWLDVYKGDEA